MRHPVRDVDIDSIDACGRDLPDAFHVNLAPLGRKRTDPHVLVALGDPERRASAKNCGLSGDLALQPVRMILGKRMRRLIRVSGDALQARDVDERMISSRVSSLRNRMNRRELFFRLEKTFISSGDIVVYLNPRNMTLLRLANDSCRIVFGLQRPRADADIVRPVLGRRSCRQQADRA